MTTVRTRVSVLAALFVALVLVGCSGDGELSAPATGASTVTPVDGEGDEMSTNGASDTAPGDADGCELAAGGPVVSRQTIEHAYGRAVEALVVNDEVGSPRCAFGLADGDVTVQHVQQADSLQGFEDWAEQNRTGQLALESEPIPGLGESAYAFSMDGAYVFSAAYADGLGVMVSATGGIVDQDGDREIIATVLGG